MGTAVLLVDLYQRGSNNLVCPYRRLDDRTGLFDDVRKLMDCASKNGWPVVVTSYRRWGRHLTEVEGHQNFEAALKIKKRNQDPFSNPQLDIFLKDQNIEALAIGGYSLYECVAITARSAKEKGYFTVTTPTILFIDTLQQVDLEAMEKVEDHFARIFRSIDDLAQELTQEKVLS